MVADAKARAKSIACLTGAGSDQKFPANVGRKFDVEGEVLPFSGNTFLCHVPQGSTAHAALREASLALQAGRVAGAFSFLPPSSFHMTVFEGVCDADRNGDTDRWPTCIARDAPLAQINQTFQTASGFMSLPAQQNVRPTGLFGGFSVALSGRSPLAEASLRRTRRVLRDVSGIYRKDFAAYAFHITLAYPVRWVTLAEANAVMDHADRVFDRLVMQAPEISLGPVEFCTFENMHAFSPQFLFDSQPPKQHPVAPKMSWSRSLPSGRRAQSLRPSGVDIRWG
jgi:hypothetical protein